MKKLLLAVIGIVLFVSCGDKKAQEDVVGTDETRSQEQKSADLIVGNWAPTNWDITQTVDGEIVFETQGDKEIQYMFLSDGTGSVIQNFRLDGKDDLQTTGSFKWAASGDKVSLTDYKFISPPNMAFGTPEFVFPLPEGPVIQYSPGSSAV